MLPKDFYGRYRESLFRIPMPGEQARSINLANAVSIAAYECYRQLNAGDAGGKFWYTMRRKEKWAWRQNADIAALQAMARDASTARPRNTNIATTPSTANGAARPAMATAAYTALTDCTGTGRATTSASGADRPRTDLAAYTPRRGATRSDGLSGFATAGMRYGIIVQHAKEMAKCRKYTID